MTKPKKVQPQNDDELSPAETERTREATLKTLLSTPPKTHDEMVRERRKAEQMQSLRVRRKRSAKAPLFRDR